MASAEENQQKLRVKRRHLFPVFVDPFPLQQILKFSEHHILLVIRDIEYFRIYLLSICMSFQSIIIQVLRP